MKTSILEDSSGHFRVAFIGDVDGVNEERTGSLVSTRESARRALSLVLPQYVSNSLASEEPRIAINRQVHSSRIVELNEPAEADSYQSEADGLLTSEQNLVLCVFTADCVPVLIANTRSGQCAALHAGWRGLADGIIGAYGEQSRSLRDAVAWIGPSIGACCYEVSEKVASLVARTSGPGVITSVRQDTDSARLGRSTPRPNLDLVRAATQQLQAIGIEDIRIQRACTKCDRRPPLGAPGWHSYRREGPGQGRNHALVWRDG